MVAVIEVMILHIPKYNKLSDGELLSIIDVDEDAFNEIYHRYYRLVYFVAYELCHNDADAKDVMQETFVKVKSNAKDLQDKDKFKYWLNAVTVSKCKDLFKKNKYGNVDHQNPYVRNHQVESRRYMLPEKQLHFNSDKKLLYKFIERLPESQREIVVLKYFSDLSIQEIAKILEVSEGTVKSRIHYAKSTLRGMIETHNKKEKNKPLNFESLDLAIASCMLYAFKTRCLLKPAKQKSLLQQGAVLNIGMVAAASTLVVSLAMGGVEYYQRSHNPKQPIANTNEQTEQIKSKDKEWYFTLMDFAATPSDMEAKTDEEMISVKPIYESLKQSNSEYYHLLELVNWIEMYEKKIAK